MGEWTRIRNSKFKAYFNSDINVALQEIMTEFSPVNNPNFYIPQLWLNCVDIVNINLAYFYTGRYGSERKKKLANWQTKMSSKILILNNQFAAFTHLWHVLITTTNISGM